jgi:hypothetical protein
MGAVMATSAVVPNCTTGKYMMLQEYALTRKSGDVPDVLLKMGKKFIII